MPVGDSHALSGLLVLLPPNPSRKRESKEKKLDASGKRPRIVLGI